MTSSPTRSHGKSGNPPSALSQKADLATAGAIGTATDSPTQTVKGFSPRCLLPIAYCLLPLASYLLHIRFLDELTQTRSFP
ncbi:MAG: hypothetical protein ACP5D7_05250 [Limnospira sp.]